MLLLFSRMLSQFYDKLCGWNCLTPPSACAGAPPVSLDLGAATGVTSREVHPGKENLSESPL